jgi:hypothetical protein
MSEDRFYSNVRSVMTDHAPEVPSAVYVGMRKKLWWSNFTRLSSTRFNLWYLLLMLAGTGIIIGLNRPSATSETSVVNSSIEIERIAPVDNQDMAVEQSAPTEIDVTEQKTNSTSSHSARATAEETAQSEPASEVAQLEQPAESAVSNEPKQEMVPTETTSPIAAGTKKGLKVKTYNTSDKKK